MLGSERPSGSSAFGLSAPPAWMSLTGSCFSSESAPRHLGAYRSSTATMTSCCVFTGAAARSPNDALFGYAQRVTTGDVPGLCNQVKVKQLSAGVIGQVFDSCSPHLDRGSHK